MQLTASIYLIVALDFILSLSIAAIYRTGDRKFLWKSISNFAILRALTSVLIVCVGLLVQRYPVSAMRTLYFVAFYTLYIALNALEFRIFYEIYRKATIPFQGFSRWSSAIFAWIVVVILALTVMNLGSPNSGQDIYARAGINFMRATETVGLCVVAMLCYLIRSMGLPWRGKVFGIMFGFMIGSLGGILETVQFQFHLESNPYVTAFYQYAGIINLLIWIGYAFLPEPLPRPVTVPAESPVYRWSQIATALGAKTSVAMPEPQHSFFLADVEQVVDKVFTRHMQESPESNG